MENIIKNDSQGYGYKYAGLDDIAIQGIKLPKMKTGTDEVSKKDYVFCWDEEIKDWVREAEIVIPESDRMNDAQLYGSALTYARRYSVLMFYGLACSDDKDIENLNKDGSDKNEVNTKQAPKTKKEKEVQKKQEIFEQNQEMTITPAQWKEIAERHPQEIGTWLSNNKKNPKQINQKEYLELMGKDTGTLLGKFF